MDYYNIVDDRYIEALKSSIVRPVFKVELMDFKENVIGEIIQDISSEDNGSISINYQQGVRRSCSLTLINARDNLKLNKNFRAKYLFNENDLWLNTKFKVYTGLKISTFNTKAQNLLYKEKTLGNNASNIIYKEEGFDLAYQNDSLTKIVDTYWFSQGIFVLTNPSVLRDMSKQTLTIEGVDKFGVFGSEVNFTQTDDVYLIEAESEVGKVVQSICTMLSDPKQPLIDSSLVNQRLPHEIKKSPESYFGDILIEIANMFAADIYYDTDGRLHFEKGNELEGFDNFPNIWEYSDKETEYFSPQLSPDFTSVYNVVKVVGNHSDYNTFVYIAENNDPRSSLRIDLIGRRVLYVESSVCTTLERTKDYAEYMLNKKSRMALNLSFQSSYMPHLDVNQAISITDEYFDYVNERFIIQSLSIPISTKNLMDIDCTNIANIPYFTNTTN